MIYTPIIVFNTKRDDKNMNEQLEEVKEIIKKNYSFADCGLFFSRNMVGDRMVNIYCKNGISIDICYGWAYFEVFGLDKVQELELMKFYKTL